MGLLDFKGKLETYDFEKLFKKLGYAYFTKGYYNLNIIGVRRDTKNKITNLFDDYLVVIYKTPHYSKRQIYNITTEPGTYYMIHHLGNSKGTAILVPGQYRGAWKIALHRGKYQALCQRKPLAVYRDGNKDNIYDMRPETIDNGIFGINIHRANAYTIRQTIDQYSAGCQVFNNPQQFTSFMNLCRKQAEIFGNNFTYTLIREQDL